MLTVLVIAAVLLAALWILLAVLRWVRYDQAAKVVEYWRQNGIG